MAWSSDSNSTNNMGQRKLNLFFILCLALFVAVISFSLQQLFILIYTIKDYVPAGGGVHTTSFEHGTFWVDGVAVPLKDIPITIGRGGLYGSLAGSIILVIGAAVFKGSITRQLGTVRPQWKGLWPWMAIAIGLSILPNILEPLFPSLTTFGERSKAMINASWYMPTYTIITISLAIPFFEELLFRGWLYGKFRDVWGNVAAVVLTSIIFVLIHTMEEPLVMLILFPVSIVFGIIRMKSGSIWPSFLIHVANNAGATIFMMLQGHLEWG